MSSSAKAVDEEIDQELSEETSSGEEEWPLERYADLVIDPGCSDAEKFEGSEYFDNYVETTDDEELDDSMVAQKDVLKQFDSDSDWEEEVPGEFSAPEDNYSVESDIAQVNLKRLKTYHNTCPKFEAFQGKEKTLSSRRMN